MTWNYLESFGIIWIPNSSKSFGRILLGKLFMSFGKPFGTIWKFKTRLRKFLVGLRLSRGELTNYTDSKIASVETSVIYRNIIMQILFSP